MEISFVNKEKVFTIKSKTHMCDHPNLVVDMDLRSVRCEKCGSDVDLFGFILSLAIKENTYESRIKNLKDEINRLEKTKQNLKLQ